MNSDDGLFLLPAAILAAKLRSRRYRPNAQRLLPVDHEWLFSRTTHEWSNIMFCLKHKLRTEPS